MLYLFPRDVLDGILDLIRSVSEGFLPTPRETRLWSRRRSRIKILNRVNWGLKTISVNSVVIGNF